MQIRKARKYNSHSDFDLAGNWDRPKRSGTFWEALSLVEKGVADVMLIPAWRQVIRYGGCRKPTVKRTVAVAARPQVSINLFGRRLDLYENCLVFALLVV